MNLLKKFQEYIQQQHLFHPKDPLLLAVSGGVDSVVLCELMKEGGYSFSIAHCNFQLRGEDSSRDETFVKHFAEKYKVRFFCKTFDTNSIAKERRTSIEETARALRYEWFEEVREQNDLSFIVTAHHADDSIETVLMNFFRGTGIRGMHGILPKQEKLLRPLLFAYKKELESFAKENKLDFVTDHTNEQSEFTRNYFRNQLIPLVKKVYPETENNMLKNIARFAEVEKLYDQAIAVHKKNLVQKVGDEIHIPVLKLKKSTPLSTIVYEIIKEYDFTSSQTEEAIALLESESGKYIQSATHRIIKNRKWLIITPTKDVDSSLILIEGEGIWDFAGGKLQVKHLAKDTATISNDPLITQLDKASIQYPLLLRKWKQGDYFYPLGMKIPASGRVGKKKLSRFFIDQKLSLTQKEKIWVLESNKRIIWVLGMRMDDRFKITGTTKEVIQFSLKKKDE